MGDLKTNLNIYNQNNSILDTNNIQYRIVLDIFIEEAVLEKNTSIENIKNTVSISGSAISVYSNEERHIKSFLELGRNTLSLTTYPLENQYRSCLYFSKYLNWGFDLKDIWVLLETATPEKINMSHLLVDNVLDINSNNLLSNSVITSEFYKLSSSIFNMGDSISNIQSTLDNYDSRITLLENRPSTGGGGGGGDDGWKELIEKVINPDGSYYVRAKAGFYSDYFISARGVDSTAGSSSGGITMEIVWDNLAKITTDTSLQQIDLSHLKEALENWKAQEGFISEETDPIYKSEPASKITQEHIDVLSRFVLDNDNIKVLGGLYTDSFLSARGFDDAGGTAGMDLSAMWNALAANTSQPISITHLTSVTDWVESKGYLTSFSEMDPVFTASPAYNLTNEDIEILRKFSLEGSNIRVSTGLFTDSFLSARGLDSTGGSGVGIDLSVVWNALATSSKEPIALTHLASVQTWVNNQGFLKGFVETDPIFKASPAYGITEEDIEILRKFSLVDNNIKVSTGLFTDSFISARGLDSNQSGGSIGLDAVWNALTSEGEEQIHLSHLGNIQKWVEGLGYITEFVETDPIFQASVASSITSSDIEKWNAIASWFELENGNIKVSNNRGLFTESFLSAKGLDSESGGHSLDLSLMWEKLAAKTDEPIALSHLASVQTWVRNQNYLNSGSLSGYATQNWVDNLYLKKDSIAGNITQDDIDSWNLIASMFELVGGHIRVKDDRGFYSNSFISSRGIDDTAAVAGIDWGALATPTTDPNAQQIHISHLTQALTGYLTEDDLSDYVDINDLAIYDTNIKSWANSRFLTSYTETDPIFESSPAGTITTDDIANWNLVASLFELIDGNIKIKNNRGLFTESFISARGLDGNTGGNIDMSSVWFHLAEEGDQQINISHLESALSGYATQDWVNNKRYITSSALQGYATETWVESQGYLKEYIETDPIFEASAASTITSGDIESWKLVASLFELDGDNIKIKNNRGLYTNSFLSARGIDEFASPSIDLTSVWAALAAETKEPIALSHLGSVKTYIAGLGYITNAALSGYATESWVNLQGFLEQSDLLLLSSQITDLQGYFENGKAKDSIRFGGELPSYYATALGLNTEISERKNADTLLSNRIKLFEDMFEWSDGNIKAKAGLFTEKFLSARGLDSESGGGSVGLDAMWSALAGNTKEPIALTHLKSVQSWVEAKDYLVESDLGGINLDLGVLKGYFTEGKANNAINSDGLKFAYVIVGKGKTILEVKNELKTILAANPYRTFYIQIKSGEQVAANWGNDSYLIGDGSTNTSWEVLTNVGHYAVIHARVYSDRAYYQVVLSNNVWGTMRKFATLDDKVADSFKLGGIDAANYYHSGNANKDNVDWTANTLTASRVLLPYLPSTWINSTKSVSQILGQRNQSEASAHSLFTVETFNRHRVTFGGIGDKVGFWGFTKANIDGNVNTQSFSTFWYPVTGDIEHSHSLQLGGLLRVGGSSGQTVTSAKVELWDKVASWFAEDSDGNIYVRNAKGLYSNSFLSAKGLDSSGSGGGGSASLDVVWDALANTTTEQINITHLTNALSGYATQSWIISQGFATQTSLNAVGTRVGTLEGYFTSGKAKTALNAEQLGGQSPSYYATASGLSSANSAISILQSYFTSGKAKLAESADYLLAVDDRDVLPNTTGITNKKAVKAFFRAKVIGTGTWADMLVLDTYQDSSGGKINALQFSKSTYEIHHFVANQGDTSWGEGRKLAYITDTVSDSEKLGGIDSSAFAYKRYLGAHADYVDSVILLIPFYTNGTVRVTGKLYSEYSGSTRYQGADIDLWYSRWSTENSYNLNVCLDTYGSGAAWQLVTCTYQGNTWLALTHTNTQATEMFFEGSVNGTLTVPFTKIDYYNSQTETALNVEINNSIVNRVGWISRKKFAGVADYAVVTDTAPDSLKLGGQLPSYYATALGLTTETNARIAADNALSNRIAVFESMFEWVDGDIRAKAGLFTNSFLSARGLDDNAGGSGAGLDAVWAALDGDTNEQINHSHLTTALSTYATQSWVNTQGFLKSTALVGYATESWVTAKGYVVNTDSRLTDARNAKDVYSWAKQSTKPTYNWGEITSKLQSSDWNTVWQNGNIGFNSSSLNSPITGATGIGVTIPILSVNQYALQISGRQNRLFFRSIENNAIGTWQELFHTGHNPSWSEVTNKPDYFTADSTYYIATVGAVGDTVLEVKNALRNVILANNAKRNFIILIVSVGQDLINNFTTDSKVLVAGNSYTTVTVTNALSSGGKAYAMLNISSYADRYNYQVALVNDVWGIPRRYATLDDTVYNAERLGGQLPSYYGKQSDITRLDSYFNSGGIAKEANATKFLKYIAGSGTGSTTAYDANLLNGGQYTNYGSGAYWRNAPTGMSYGGITSLSNNYSYGGKYGVLSIQLAHDVNHNVTNSTRNLWFRTQNNLGWQNDWKQIWHSGNSNRLENDWSAKTLNTKNIINNASNSSGIFTQKQLEIHSTVGGWARGVLQQVSNSGLLKFFIGTYGANDDTIHYSYLGSASAYNSVNNFKIYSDGSIGVQQQTGSAGSVGNITKTKIALWDKIASLFILDANNDILIAEGRGLYSNSFLSAKGLDSAAGGGSIDLGAVWDALDGETDEQINKSHLTNALSTYVETTDVRLTNARPASDVYTWAKAASKPTYSWTEILSKPTHFDPVLNTTDWNTITKTGFNWSASNKPLDFYGSMAMGISVGYTDTNYNFQLAGRNNRVAFRTKEAGVIGSWLELYHTGHKPTWSEIESRPTKLSQFTKDINFDERYFTETEINTKLSGYLPLSGGTLTGGASISSNGNIYLQQASTSNATGMFWQNMANTTNLVGIGAYTTGDTINGIYMGWGSTPWEAVTNFRVTSTDIRYKNNIVYHAGNQSLIQAIKVNSAILSDEVFVSNTFNPTDLAVDTQRVKFYDSYNVSGTPTTYGNVMEINGIASHWKPQLWFDGGATPSSRVRYRSRNYNATSWGEWKTLAFTTDTAPDSLKLGGQSPSYYATASGLTSANSAITTLQSYFTSGKAKTALNAEKLGNILAANYYHTANSNLSTIDWNAKEYYASGWYRTTGDTGIYFGKHGGGLYMADTAYVTVYGSKKFKVVNNSFDSVTTTGGYHTTNRAFGLVGTYDSAKTQAIWNMGGTYAANTDGSGLGNLYGAAYAYQNHSSVGNLAGGHQFLWCENGVVKSALGQNVWTSGSVLLGGTIEIKTSTITKEKVDRWDRICALFETDSAGDVYLTGSKGIYSNSFVSARGLDEESSTIVALQAEIVELKDRINTLEVVLGLQP